MALLDTTNIAWAYVPSVVLDSKYAPVLREAVELWRGKIQELVSQSSAKQVTPILICGLMGPSIRQILPLGCLHRS